MSCLHGSELLEIEGTTLNEKRLSLFDGKNPLFLLVNYTSKNQSVRFGDKKRVLTAEWSAIPHPGLHLRRGRSKPKPEFEL